MTAPSLGRRGAPAVATLRSLAALLAAALFAGAAPGAAAATRLFIRNHVNSNDVRGLAAWNGDLVAATTGGLVTVAMPAGPLVKTIAAPAGLPSNHTLALAASPSGDLWIGTADAGVARLAPGGGWRRTLTTFDGLPSNDAQALLRTGDSVWVGTAGGVALFAENPVNARVALRRSDSRASTAGALVSDDVRALAILGDTLWAGTGGGLAAFAAGAWWDKSAVFAGAVNALLVQGDTLWVGTAAGPRAYRAGLIGAVDAGYAGASLSLAIAGGGLYSGSGGGVYRRSGGGWVLTGAGLPIGGTAALGMAPDGALWSGQSTGLARYDPGADVWTPHRTEGPAVESLQKAAVRDHEAWFTPGNTTAPGIGAGFLLHTDGSAWSVASNTSTGGAIQTTSVFGILAARDGDLWLGHCCSPVVERPRVEKFDPATNTSIVPGPSNVWAFGQAPDGRVYGAGVELENGVYVFDPESGAVVDSLTPGNTQGSARGAGLSSNNLRGIAFDPARAAWIATAENGVDRWDGRGTDAHADDFWDHFATGFPSTKTLAVAALDTATAYVGTQAGIVVITAARLDLSRMRDVNDVIGAVPVQDLAADPRRVVWIATTAGLGRYDDAARVMERFTTADGLVDDDVRGLAWDESRGILWVATARGVSEVHPQAAGVPALGPGAYAFPNPATAGSGAVRIGGLSGAVTGEIRDLAGNLVRNFRADPVASAAWDLRDASGVPAAPGVYLIVIRDGSRVHTLRIAVTR